MEAGVGGISGAGRGKTRRGREWGGAWLMPLCLRLMGPWVCYLIAPLVTAAYWAAAGAERAAVAEVRRRALGGGRLAAHAGAFANFLYFAYSMMDRVFAHLSGRMPPMRLEGAFQDRWIRDGAIILGAHFGDWSLCGSALPDHKSKSVHVVMDLSINPTFAKAMGNLASFKVSIIDASKGTVALLLGVKQALEAGDVVCFLADRGPVDGRTVAVPFLGTSAPWHLGPFEIAARMGKPLLAVFCTKEGLLPSSPYVVRLEELHAGGDERPDPESLLRRYVASLEARVAGAPSHWFNFFRFWTRLH